MKRIYVKHFLLLLLVASCATTHKSINKKEFRRSKTLVTYSGMGDDLQDGYLVLKENNYFVFYQRIWLVGNIKHGEYVGRYDQQNDTLYLNWLGTDPKQIKYYLSAKCIIDAGTKQLWFIGDSSDEKLWRLRRVTRQ